MRITKDVVRSLSDDSASLSGGKNVSVRMIITAAQNNWDGPAYHFNTALAPNIRGRHATRYAAFFIFGAVQGWNRYARMTLPKSVTQYNQVLGNPRTMHEWTALYRGWKVGGREFRGNPGPTIDMREFHERARAHQPDVCVSFLTATGSSPYAASGEVVHRGSVYNYSDADGRLVVRLENSTRIVNVAIAQVTRVY